MTAPLFPAGRLLITANAQHAGVTRADAITLLQRHLQGDWGELEPEDRTANNHAVRSGDMLLSAYTLRNGTRVWIETTGDRSATVVMLPEDH